MTKPNTETYFTISNSEGRQGRVWDDEYGSRNEAASALATAMGWDACVESESFTIDNGDAVCCYETEEECAADQEGAYAPRINEFEREVDPDEQCPEHGCAKWRCAQESHGPCRNCEIAMGYCPRCGLGDGTR